MDLSNRSHIITAAMLTVGSALYGVNYVWSRYVDPQAGMINFVAQASVFTWLTLLFLAPGKPRRGPTWQDWVAIVFNGASGPIILMLILEGSKLVTPALSSIIVVSNVLLIAVISRLMGRKRFIGAQAPALIAGFCGVGWISASRGGFHGEAEGVALLAGAALLIAAVTLAIEKPIKNLGWAPVTRWLSAVALVAVYAGIAAFGELKLLSYTQTALSALMGVFSLGVAGVLFSIGIGRLGSADTSVFKLLIPFFSLVYGAVLFAEIPDPASLMASLLVVGSLIVYNHAGLITSNAVLVEQTAPERIRIKNES